MANSHSYGVKPSDFRVDDIVFIHPATDTFMRGQRYGVVTKIGRQHVHVRLAGGKTVRAFHASLLAHDDGYCV